MEQLLLAGSAAGLRGSRILRKRGIFRSAFDGLPPADRAPLRREKQLTSLSNDGAVIVPRPRQDRVAGKKKISTRQWPVCDQKTAQALSKFLWDFVERQTEGQRFKTTASVIPPSTRHARSKFSKELGARASVRRPHVVRPRRPTGMVKTDPSGDVRLP